MEKKSTEEMLKDGASVLNHFSTVFEKGAGRDHEEKRIGA